MGGLRKKGKKLYLLRSYFTKKGKNELGKIFSAPLFVKSFG